MKTIPLTQGKCAIVDDEDYEQLNQWKWIACKSRNTFYAAKSAKINGYWSTKKMHHFILPSIPKGSMVDHKNRNGLDNRKNNLRICSIAQNTRNRKTPPHSSKYKGVCWEGRRKAWRAYITIKGKFIHIGYFNKEERAAIAYDKAAKTLFGEFAYTNF